MDFLNAVRVCPLPDGDPIFFDVPPFTIVHDVENHKVYVRASEWPAMEAELRKLPGSPTELLPVH